jgi:putative NIF3 family GTP cyclohydrolase 1 type 2
LRVVLSPSFHFVGVDIDSVGVVVLADPGIDPVVPAVDATDEVVTVDVAITE